MMHGKIAYYSGEYTNFLVKTSTRVERNVSS